MRININDDSRSYLTDDEYKFLLLLELHESFESDIKEFQNKIGLFKFNGEYPSLFLYDSDIARLLEKLNIPISLFFAIKSIIYTGSISQLEPPLTIYQENNLLGDMTRQQKIFNELSFPYHSVPYPTIRIKKRLSKAELFQHIEDQWFKLDKFMGILENSAPFPVLVSHISVRDIEDSVKIYKYKKAGLKYKEIKNKLDEEGNRIDEPTIRKKYSQLNKLLNDLKFVKK